MYVQMYKMVWNKRRILLSRWRKFVVPPIYQTGISVALIICWPDFLRHLGTERGREAPKLGFEKCLDA